MTERPHFDVVGVVARSVCGRRARGFVWLMTRSFVHLNDGLLRTDGGTVATRICARAPGAVEFYLLSLRVSLTFMVRRFWSLCLTKHLCIHLCINGSSCGIATEFSPSQLRTCCLIENISAIRINPSLKNNMTS